MPRPPKSKPKISPITGFFSSTNARFVILSSGIFSSLPCVAISSFAPILPCKDIKKFCAIGVVVYVFLISTHII